MPKHFCFVVQSLSHVQFYATPWTAACQALCPWGFSRQEFWSGLTFPSPGDLLGLGFEPMSFTLAGGFFTTDPPRKPLKSVNLTQFSHRGLICVSEMLFAGWLRPELLSVDVGKGDSVPEVEKGSITPKM